MDDILKGINIRPGQLPRDKEERREEKEKEYVSKQSKHDCTSASK